MACDTEQALTELPCPAKSRGRVWITLPARADFLRLTASNLRRATPGFVLQAAPRASETPGLRIGFTASKKVGNAVARSRAKRRLRALADKVMPEAADPARDYVFIGRADTLTRDFAVMEQDLRAALKKMTPAKA